MQTYGDHVLKHSVHGPEDTDFFPLKKRHHSPVLAQISTVASLNRQHIHVSISEFGKTVYMHLEPDIFVVE